MRRYDRLRSTLLLPMLVGCAIEEPLPPEPAVIMGLDEAEPVFSEVRPPPISGGTLLVSRDSTLAVVSDPDRDRVLVTALPSGPAREIMLSRGDQPGRAVEDARGRAHVVLRGGGAVLTVGLSSGEVLARRAVCDEPRGIAFDPARDALHVACASGELVELSSVDLKAPLRSVLQLAPDLRDVVVAGDRLLVSRFRGASVLVVSRQGVVLAEHRPELRRFPNLDGEEREYQASVAWRLLATGDGDAVMVRTMASLTPLDPDSGGYGGDCDGPTHAEVGVVTANGFQPGFAAPGLARVALPVDVAQSPDGAHTAVIDATEGLVAEFDISSFDSGPCGASDSTAVFHGHEAEPIAIAYEGSGMLIVQNREPSRLDLFVRGSRVGKIELGGASRTDTGHELFHGRGSAATVNGLSCASCHPEGRDDGHVWTFTGAGPRRSQSLAGTLEGTAPYHWEGDLSDLDALMHEVMAERMGASGQSSARVGALESWLSAVARPVRPSVAFVAAIGSAARGRDLFYSAETQCGDCHSGPMTTNNETVSIGKGRRLQVPSLVGIGTRGPYMHDGCAPTLHDRFDWLCGGLWHGRTEHLGRPDIDDLVAFMLTL